MVLLVHHWRDKNWHDEFVQQVYEIDEGFSFIAFHDGDLENRQSWQEEVREKAGLSKAAVLLISPGFFSSELPLKVAAAYIAEQIPVVKVLLRNVDNPRQLTSLPGLTFPREGVSYERLDTERREKCLRNVVEWIQETLNQSRKPLAPSSQPPIPPPPVDPPADLLKACLARQCVLFAGAGLSSEVGLPSPQGLAEGLLEWSTGRQGFDKELEESLKSLLDKAEPDLAFEGLVESSEKGADEVLTYLRKALLVSAKGLAAPHNALRGIGFSGVVTSNWDILIEETLGVSDERIYTLREAERLLDALSKNEFFLLKLYGTLSRPDTVFLTSARYRDAVAGSVPFGQFLSSLFYMRTFLFVGKNLQGIEEFLTSIPSRSATPPRHFAVVLESEPAWKVKSASLRRRFGLELVTIPSGGLGPFLGGLVRQVQREHADQKAAPGPSAAAAATETARLARVAVENIGPFARLELDIHPRWNLFLGDNGVGKSSVLKAIATAIVGEEAAPFAGRLIRAGATSAKVMLTTDKGDTYVTEIFAKESGARVNTIPMRPLEKEGWLAVGFPPLRTVSWERPTSYEAVERGRPVPGDILPLVRGDADPRLDKLKAWLLYLDHNIKEQSKGKVGDDRHARLWKEFFRVVDRVTPGVNVAPGRVDASRRQVYVRTDDGEVPIEAVSQGTQSLMGWIGIVLQRLFEVYGSDEDPTRRYVLVLMDEIDAHMHPSWQQTLVGTLKEVFPKAQFLATSHSPLVVSSLSKDEVLIFRRDPEAGRRVRVDRPLEDLKGWRVDQILTSPSFGLEGARDKGTVDIMARYTELVSKFEPTAEERKELDILAREIGATVPPPHSLPEAREASRLIEEALRQRLESIPKDERRKMVQEIRAQIQEAMTGARRPT